VYAADDHKPVGSKLTTTSEAVESLSINLGTVFAVYLLSYLVLRLVTFLLGFLGELGTDLAVNLWAINFVFATVTALVVKRVMALLKVDHILDSGTLTRLSGMSVDVMVAAAVGAISLVVVGDYWLPIVVIALVVGLTVFFTVPWMASRLFRNYRFQRALIIFGGMTGTLPTGLALLRMLDPDFDTPVANDYVYTSALVFLLAIPMILSINLPAYSVSRSNPFLFWLTVIIVGGYVLLAGVGYRLIARDRSFSRPRRWWYERPSRER
jgi:ESS family glutamate:Na+ symporter